MMQVAAGARRPERGACLCARKAPIMTLRAPSKVTAGAGRLLLTSFRASALGWNHFDAGGVDAPGAGVPSTRRSPSAAQTEARRSGAKPSRRPFRPPYLARSFLSLTLWMCAPAPAGEAGPCLCDAAGVAEPYARTAWPAVHRDSRNSDFAPFVTARSNRVAWTALDGAATLLAPTIGPEGNLYITTGRGPGTSHLHAFDRDGQLLWESAPQTDLDDLDSAAIAGAPTIDEDGNLYIDDSNQLWAFAPDGHVRWVADLPEAGSWFSSPILTPGGLVGGVTIDGKVALYRREDGMLAVPVLDLPGGPGPSGPEPPPGLWAGGFVDPAIIAPIFNQFFGYEFEVANTAAVHPDTGRIYITAAGPTVAIGVLYGIDVEEDGMTIAFEAPMGPGSGTSPAISADHSQVYAADGAGIMYAFDAMTGELAWTFQGAAAAASPTVGPDGTVYTGGGESLLALDPSDGRLRWSRGFDDVARSFLRRRFPSRFFPTGQPVARTNSVISVSTEAVLVVLVLGYEFEAPDAPSTLIQPHVTLLAVLDPSDGRLVGSTVLRDTNEGLISIGSDGSLYVSHGSILSSLFYYQVDPQLPRFWRIRTAPIGGLSALHPTSFAQLVEVGVERTELFNGEAISALTGLDTQEAASALGRACAQLCATVETLVTDAVDEMTPETAAEVDALLGEARTHLETAGALVDTDPESAIPEIELANDALWNARAALHGGTTRAPLDVGPGSCPNLLARRARRRATVKVAVLGYEGLDAGQIDPASVSLSRSDLIGGTVRPKRRLCTPASYIADVASPEGDGGCTCHVAEPDGIMDHVFVFASREIAEALKLGSTPIGQEVEVVLHGELTDGSLIEARNCAIVTAR